MKLKNALTASVAGAALFALAAPVATSDAKADISNGNKNSLTISGQIVRSILWADDGTKDDVFQTDGGTTSSRVRWVAKGQLNEATTVGGIIEMNIPQPNPMGSATLTDAGRGTGNGDWATRKTDISVAHKQFGTVSFGKGDPFTNGITENGVGMGVLSGGVNNRPTAAGFVFRNGSTGAATAIEAGDVFTNLDMHSRTVRVGYETPSFAGFSVGADWIDGSGGDVGVKYSGKFGGFAVDAGVGYVAYDGLSTARESRIGGSVGVEHDSGIGAALMYATDDAGAAGTDDPEGWGAGLSYAAGLYSAGATKFNVTYYSTENTQSNGDEGTSWQAAVLQKFDAVGVDAGLMYTHMSYDDSGATDYDDISTVLFSARMQF